MNWTRVLKNAAFVAAVTPAIYWVIISVGGNAGDVGLRTYISISVVTALGTVVGEIVRQKTQGGHNVH